MIDDRIDKLADEFEEAWNSGQRMTADMFLLGQVGDDENTGELRALLDELRSVEQDLRRKYPATDDPNTPLPLRQIGNYEFLEKIGRGGMGELYRARHVLLDKIVAIKILPEAIAGNLLAIKRFERELKLIGNLSHPNIVQAHGAERIGEKLLLVMEYVDGVNLQQLMASGKKLPIDEAVKIIRQIAAGLQHAHEQKILHRDIKPANIMLTKGGTAKILDFGLGKFHDQILLPESPETINGSGQLTQMGAPLGTLDFLSPEQWDNPSGVDMRADIYGLGCTFYAIVVGDVPYPTEQFGTLREKMLAHIWHPLPSLSAKGVAANPTLEAILRKMCAKDREHRYATLQDVLDALDEYQRSHEIPAVIRRSRWKRTVVIVIASCSIGLITFIVPYTYTLMRPPAIATNGSSPVPDIPSAAVSFSMDSFVQNVLASRYGGDVRTARRLCREWLDEAENTTDHTPAHAAVVQELYADCALYNNDPKMRGYEFYVEEADELYLRAIEQTDCEERRNILNSKRALLQMIAGNPLLGLKTLEIGDSLAAAEENLGKSFLLYEIAKGLGNFYAAESPAERQTSLRRVLDRFRLNSPAITFSDDISWEQKRWEQERFDLQLLCIRQLLEAGLESEDMEAVKRDAATYLDSILLGTAAGRRDLRPYLRKDFDLAIRCYHDDLLKQAAYIYCMRMDETPREGVAQLVFYLTRHGGFALFLPDDLSGGIKFELPWTREDLRNHRANRSPDDTKFILNEQLIALVQEEWDAGRKVTLSWNDEVCYPSKVEGLSSADWFFDAQLDIKRFTGIEK